MVLANFRRSWKSADWKSYSDRTVQRDPRNFALPRDQWNFIFLLVFADSFRQIGLAVYPGFCPRIHEREQSVRDGERMREGAIEERTFTHERKRSPEERKEFVSEKG